ncbi:MAG: iron-containing alcohol dehydrogenase [Syntrophobacteraceae bacterium]|jgi:alcohol dehydrogenase class IV
MGMNFEFATANRILFGPGSLREVASIAVQLGNRALLVTGRSPDRASPLIHQLESKGVSVFTFNVTGEPTIETVQTGASMAREHSCRLVIGFGGGSIIDTGKTIAAVLANKGDLYDYLELIGKGRPLAKPSLPCIAIPTTAGTGSEATRNAVLRAVEHRIKVSLRSPYMLPRVAVVDPDLTRSLTPPVTAATGLDALTQLIEPYVCNNPNPLTDALCREGIRRVSRSLRRAYYDGNDIEARTDMSLASLFSGIALANARLGAVHGLAGPLGGLLLAPHGAICARLLPIVMKANLKSLEEKAPNSPVLVRFSEIARLMTGKGTSNPADGVGWLQSLCEELDIPSLSQYGLSRQMIPAISAQALKTSSMKGNPIELRESELSNILEQAL